MGQPVGHSDRGGAGGVPADGGVVWCEEVGGSAGGDGMRFRFCATGVADAGTTTAPGKTVVGKEKLNRALC